MDFELTTEQRDIKKAARDFAVGEFSHVARDYDLKETFPAEILKKARELGFLGLFVPEEYGGPGLGFLDHALVLEEFWKIDPGIGQQLCSVTFGAEELLLFGSENQKKRYLSPIFEGDGIMGFAITEPDAGSDTASAVTTAVRDGDDYIINGTKVMIGNGSVGTFLLVFCLTNPEEKSKTSRHSIIIVETDREGYEADRMEGKMGLRCSDTAMVYFNNVRVPRENLVGEEGGGFIQLMKFFDRSRAYVAAHGLGLAQGAMDMAVRHARQRRQFGRPIGTFQATQFKIAEMATKIESARNMVYKSAWLLDQERPDTKLTAMAKLYACRVAVEVVDEALQIHGGYGYFNDNDIERFYRAAKVLEIYEGTKEVEKIVIAREILGRLR
ncbi:MAG: acyl-CoA dehydrogenase family protein [Deltaproteobacteria bacterium]|nr:acyl-CoA dehydrogenase family protein [Deltaproteobacteria bacterium]MBW2111042.1 acyl-CoA dehydrogenase family protein [Deltaproteobacteria bacterium]MBW2354172.1 acyl-CoA dehydrogenase family protein [Deltaproteobacteria bacterium]